MKNVCVILLILFSLIGNADPMTKARVKLKNSKSDLRDVFIDILQQTGIPILYEGSPQKMALIDIPILEGTVEDILNSLSGSDYKWYIQDGIIIFQNKKFISSLYYPIRQYRFNLEINTDNLEFFLKKTSFFNDLSKERIINYGIKISYASPKTFKKTYKDATLRRIIIDLLKDSHSFAFIYIR